MPLKRKFNLKNLGSWVIKKEKRKVTTLTNLTMVVFLQVCDTITPIHECLPDVYEWNPGCLGCEEI
jgi:hypothetical protein